MWISEFIAGAVRVRPLGDPKSSKLENQMYYIMVFLLIRLVSAPNFMSIYLARDPEIK